MTEKEFIDMVCQGSRNNQELEDKVKKQNYVYIKNHLEIIKARLVGIDVFPYGLFTVESENRKYIKLNWKDYGTTWSLDKKELEK